MMERKGRAMSNDAERLARAKLYMRADRYVWNSSKPSPKTQELTDWLDAALRLLDERDAEIARLRQANAAAARQARAEMREEAARVIEEGQESHRSSASEDRYYLSSRTRGNLAGLAYAEAIRALPDLPPSRDIK